MHNVTAAHQIISVQITQKLCIRGISGPKGRRFKSCHLDLQKSGFVQASPVFLLRFFARSGHQQTSPLLAAPGKQLTNVVICTLVSALANFFSRRYTYTVIFRSLRSKADKKRRAKRSFSSLPGVSSTCYPLGWLEKIFSILTEAFRKVSSLRCV